MVRKVLLLFFVAVIVLSAAILFLNARNKDIRQIQRNLNTVVSLVEKEAGETSIICIAKTQKLASFFMEDCQIEAGSPVPHITNRDEVIGTVSQICRFTDALAIELAEVSIVLESESLAKSDFVATAVVSGSLIEKESVYPRQLDITWEKVGREWKIKRVEVIEILR